MTISIWTRPRSAQCCAPSNDAPALNPPGPVRIVTTTRGRRGSIRRRSSTDPDGREETDQLVHQHQPTAARRLLRRRDPFRHRHPPIPRRSTIPRHSSQDLAAERGSSPAQLVLDLLVALLEPVADAVDPHDLGQARGRVGFRPRGGRRRSAESSPDRVRAIVAADGQQPLPSSREQASASGKEHQPLVAGGR